MPTHDAPMSPTVRCTGDELPSNPYVRAKLRIETSAAPLEMAATVIRNTL
jgi:hypothetical protein